MRYVQNNRTKFSKLSWKNKKKFRVEGLLGLQTENNVCK